ncbi:MAG: IS66 family transposase [Desulfobulbaceae bacterium]|nr:IS66 family transposase [Desulfobulbaceae bacterium]
MISAQCNLSENTVDLKEIIQSQGQQLESKNQEIERLEEENRLLRQALFAPKSEKRKDQEPSPQLPLFDIPENPPADEESKQEEEIIVPEHTRKKKGRKPIPDHLPRIEIVHDIADDEKKCACGCELSRIGEDISEKLDIVPAVMRVIRHVRPKYACKNCEGVEDDSKSVKIAPAPPQIIPKGIATAGLLAYVVTAKFCDALPFYRQEKQFIRLGVDIPRQTMCNWTMIAAERCQLLLDLLHKEIRGGPLIHVDETTVQVLDEPGRKATQKSYMWIFRGGAPDHPAVVYQYHPTRSGDVAKLFLDGYHGVVQTDGYKGYDFLDSWQDILHVGCWAHARRKFVKALDAGTKKASRRANKALTFIRNLYSLEKFVRQNELKPDDIYSLRQEQAKPILEKMKAWLMERKSKVTPSSLFGQAVHYCLNQWHRLSNYIESGNAAIDNNAAENGIRPFVIGRKNWLFSGTPEGAEASALLYSLIETAKANNLEPFSYLRFLFEKLPTTPMDKLATLLPTKLTLVDLTLPDTPSGI